MNDRTSALTPDALVMVDTIARTGSFAAAARELGKVPSALTYSVRQLEDALDVLLFDRSSRQAQLTAAGHELLNEGRRLLAEIDAVANRVRRVAAGWEGQLTIAIDDVIARRAVFDLCEAFYALDPQGSGGVRASGGPGTRLKLRTEVLAGTWEALVSGEADLAIGVPAHASPPRGIATEALGTLAMVFTVAPHHPLATHDGPISNAEALRWRAVAVADSAQRSSPITVNLLPGQDVLTVDTIADKIELLRRGVGCGYLPLSLARAFIDRGDLVVKPTLRDAAGPRIAYAWRCTTGPKGAPRPPQGLALQWWLQQLSSPTTRKALLDAP